MLFRLSAQTVFSAITQMWANKARAALTTLGIIIGVWAITAVIAAIGSLNGWVMKGFEELGANKLELWGQVPEGQRGRMSWQKVKLNQTDADAIRQHAESVDLLALYANESCRARTAYEEKGGVRVTAIEAEWLEINNRTILEGQPIQPSHVEDALQVCLINEHGVEELRLDNGGVGEHIFLNDHRFLIIGIIQTKDLGPMFGGGEARAEVYVPFPMIYKLDRWPWPQATIRMKTEGSEFLGKDWTKNVEEEIRFILRNVRGLKPGEDDTFDMFVIESIVDNMRKIGDGMLMGASVMVGISLLVGGIGIMNIMLVSVSERTREIGLRKAVGANPLVILLQFLIEAVILCLGGGLLGLVLGQLTVLGMTSVDQENWPFADAQIPIWAIVLAIGFSAGVGIVFGMWPAVKAARLNPIEALRHE